eukprot:augustus_masked-scaffold_26-processed-gene-3.10-mRNA-1 protein AED:0.10 eAED:0.10 QI:0/-1/0/1/-1/1/1/0/379
MKNFIRNLSRSTSVVPRSEIQSFVSLGAGSGGRSSFTGKQITIFGASGFVARYLANELGRSGNNIIYVTRGDDLSLRHLKPLADYGRTAPYYFDPTKLLTNPDEFDLSLRKAMEDSDIVINLIGKTYETRYVFPWIKNWTFENVHVSLPKKIAQIAREMDVKHFIHMSSVAADEKSRSEWAKTKALGEKAVEEEFPGRTLLRSNVIYGDEDSFLNPIAMALKTYPIVPLIYSGKSEICPIWVADVADVLKQLCNYEFAGDTIEIHGKHQYSYKQIYEYVADTIWKKDVKFLDIPANIVQNKFIQKGLELSECQPNPSILWTKSGAELFGVDQVKREGVLGCEDVGVEPVEFERKAFNYLYKYRPGGHFADPKSEHIVHS